MKKLMAVVSAVLMVAALAGCSKKVEKGEYTIEKDVFKVGMEIG